MTRRSFSIPPAPSRPAGTTSRRWCSPNAVTLDRFYLQDRALGMAGRATLAPTHRSGMGIFHPQPGVCTALGHQDGSYHEAKICACPTATSRTSWIRPSPASRPTRRDSMTWRAGFTKGCRTARPAIRPKSASTWAATLSAPFCARSSRRAAWPSPCPRRRWNSCPTRWHRPLSSLGRRDDPRGRRNPALRHGHRRRASGIGLWSCPDLSAVSLPGPFSFTEK